MSCVANTSFTACVSNHDILTRVCVAVVGVVGWRNGGGGGGGVVGVVVVVGGVVVLCLAKHKEYNINLFLHDLFINILELKLTSFANVITIIS